MVKVKVDMTGWKMWEHGVPDSKLTVIQQIEDYVNPQGKHFARWLCECNCEKHKQIEAIGADIRNGHTKSCGCLQDIASTKLHKTNVYSKMLTDQYGCYYIGYTTNTNQPFYIDAEDYNKVKDYCWCESTSNGVTKVVSRFGKRVLSLHQFLGFSYYDHIDRNELNNRHYNLRKCTYSQNSMNRGLQSNNTSGITGVTWDKRQFKWKAQIKIDHKQINIGLFFNKDDAIRARLRAEVKYFGEFAPQHHLFEQYGIEYKPENKIKGGDTNE